MKVRTIALMALLHGASAFTTAPLKHSRTTPLSVARGAEDVYVYRPVRAVGTAMTKQSHDEEEERPKKKHVPPKVSKRERAR